MPAISKIEVTSVFLFRFFITPRFPSRPARTRTFNQDSLESAAAAIFQDVMDDEQMGDFGL